MSNKTNDTLREMVYNALALDIKNVKDTLTLEDFGALLATCFKQEELNVIAADITEVDEIDQIIKLQKYQMDSISRSLKAAFKK